MRRPPCRTARSPSTEPGAELGDARALDRRSRDEHAVDDDVELVAGITLAGQYLTGLQSANGRVGRVAEEHLGELPLQRRLGRGDEGRRVLVAPRRVDTERRSRPGLPVSDGARGVEATIGVVDPVAREGRRAGQPPVDPPVGVQCELERRPRDGQRRSGRTAAAASPSPCSRPCGLPRSGRSAPSPGRPPARLGAQASGWSRSTSSTPSDTGGWPSRPLPCSP